MSDRRGTESEFELTTIARLEQLGYTYAPGVEIDRPADEAVLRRNLRNFLTRQYRDLPDAAIEQAVIHSFRELLEATLQRYHNRLIDAADVIRVMLQIREQELRDQQRAHDLHLAPEELAFYDAVAENLAAVYDQQFLTSLIHDIVQAVKRNLKVDWTEPHRDTVKAEVRSAVRRVLRAREVRREDFDYLIERVMEQAVALYASWPLAA